MSSEVTGLSNGAEEAVDDVDIQVSWLKQPWLMIDTVSNF